MKKVIAAGVVGLMSGAGLLVGTGAAHALYSSNCSGVTEGGVTVGTVTGPSNGGAGTGVCVGLPATLPNGAANPFQGGAVEAGAGSGGSRLCVQGQPTQVPGPGVYVIADGNDANTLSESSGYIGLSNNETGGQEPCPQPGATGTPSTGSGTNSGGYVGVKPLGVYAPVPLVACGFTSGPNFSNAGRDGCAAP
jgi:hypothetical protein